MELKLIGNDGQSAKDISASDALFGREYNEALVHQLVTAYMANARSANRAQKGRADVNKSTRKPWNQKGTGRARAGMASSPLWRGGGQIFPSSPNDNFSHKVNRKMYRAGMSTILSQLVRDSRLSVVDEFTVDSPKTRLLSQKLKDMGLKEVMLITDKIDEILQQLWIHELGNRRIGELSGGQQQRVFIAKALVNHPKILILDEPVTGIDQQSIELFYSILRELNSKQKITIIWSSHDLDAVNKLANHVACLNRTLFFHGESEKFFSDDKLVKQYSEASMQEHMHHH